MDARVCSPAAGSAIRVLPAICWCLLGIPSAAVCQTPSFAEPPPLLKQLHVDGASVFSADDIRWLLDLREGSRLPGHPGEVAKMLERRYEREGYTAAEVVAVFDEGTGLLRLQVDEGRIDAIDIHGVKPDAVERYRNALTVRVGDVYNERVVRRDVRRVLAETNGAVQIGRPGRAHAPGAVDDIALIERSGQRVLVVPLREDAGWFRLASGTGDREDLFSPVDGLNPSLDFEAAVFDAEGRNYTFVSGFGAYKFAPERPGYSFGMERSFGGPVRWYVGADLHDLTASDDLWRLTALEQSLVALAFKNTFRDYYRRRGLQVHSAARAGGNHELVVAWRRDRHEPLANETDYSFFRDDHPYRQNAPIAPADVRAVVLGYTYDSRGLDTTAVSGSYRRHLLDDLFRATTDQRFGWRFDWTGEVAGHGLGGDHEYQRHIFNTRAYVPLAPRQSIAARLMLGHSDGTLPIERRFALGGVGTVHGYRFKEVTGGRMALVNLEYRVSLSGAAEAGTSRSGLGVLLFYDAGRIGRPLLDSSTSWLNGVGVGAELAFIRIEVGFRASDIPSSAQVLVRLAPTF